MELVMSRGLSPGLPAVHPIELPVYDKIVNAVFHVITRIWRSEEPDAVRFVFGKQDLRRAIASQPAPSKRGVVQFDHAGAIHSRAQVWLVGIPAPRPGVPKPHGGKHVQGGRNGTPIHDGYAQENIF